MRQKCFISFFMRENEMRNSGIWEIAFRINTDMQGLRETAGGNSGNGLH